jgi:hypothetical protein
MKRYQLPSPELNDIKLIISIEDVSTKIINFKFEFILNYGSNSDIIEDTNYHLPMMLYIKYKNFERLRIRSRIPIGNTSGEDPTEDPLTTIWNRCFSSDLNHLDITISLKFISEYPLTHFWARQANILVIESLIKNNFTLVNWLDTIIGYRNSAGQLILYINESRTPKILTGNYKKPISDSQESFLRDSYILEKRCEIENTYTKGDRPNEVDVSIKVKRLLTNTSKDISIYGFFSCVDEKILNKSIELRQCKVNDLNVLNDVKFYPLPKSTAYEYEPTGTYGMFIPFKIPLIYPDEKKIEYELSFKASIKDMHYTAGVYNVRTRKEIEVAEIKANWDQNLFDENFQTGISFRGKFYDASTLFETLKYGKNYQDCKAFKKVVVPQLCSNFYKFSCKAYNIKPYCMTGLAWEKKILK